MNKRLRAILPVVPVPIALYVASQTNLAANDWAFLGMICMIVATVGYIIYLKIRFAADDQ